MRTPWLVCLAPCVVVVSAGMAIAAEKVRVVPVRIGVDSDYRDNEGFLAMDGDPATIWHTRADGWSPPHPHQIVLDLGEPLEIGGFTYLPRSNGGNGTISNYEFYVTDDPKDLGPPVAKGTFARNADEKTVTLSEKKQGRYVCLRAPSCTGGDPWTSIAELKILSDGVRFVRAPDIVPDNEVGNQFRILTDDLKRRGRYAKVAHEALHPAAVIDKSDRDPLDVVPRRTAALLDDLKRMPDAPDLSALEQEFAALQAEVKELRSRDDEVRFELFDKENQLLASRTIVFSRKDEARFELFEKAYHLRRKIAFSNPLLNFDKILFIKRHRPHYNHMCDQFYGMAATPGGGVYVLSDPFGPNPQVRDVLADAVVENGRLKGRKLSGGPTTPPVFSFDGYGNRSGPDSGGGSFLSPDLSYDGKSILFAFVECTGEMLYRHHTDPSKGHWDEGRCFHIFKVNVDGTNLEQLTDGTFNDFDPCWLPNGRIAFISERRGGYSRCGRVGPIYTLYDMAADGSDIRCLSFHETNEWHPSVTHDGRIIYTRWDYVDRHGCTAHLPWITTLDGRDARAVHGNFAPRGRRPDMELDVRAVPGSHKYVATAAPHHGQGYGSLVLVDPHVEDDDGMAPIKRITPDVGFPESQGGSQVYATAWPLGENYYLCVYDPKIGPGAGQQGDEYFRGDYGIYLVDAFGNKELLYRDPEIACLSPMPLRPRPVPAAPPEVTLNVPANHAEVGRVLGDDTQVPEGTVAVIDVYNSLRPWPEGTKIRELRVLQLLPMSVPSGPPPHETGMRLPSARDSVNPARHVLGTVPVEKDGSAHFTIPAQKEIFFQALDENGLAVQSMRSATYLQAGEQLVCQGCHERPHRTPRWPAGLPTALRREPSRLQPEVEGSNPFSYPRLVQPVLDRHCVECHANEADKAPNLAREPVRRQPFVSPAELVGKKGEFKLGDGRNWYASYFSLAPNYGFHNYGETYRTTPGKFGAHASRLYEILKKGHHDVALSKEEMRRITLWLDCSSLFYGVFEEKTGHAQLRGEAAVPTLQ